MSQFYDEIELDNDDPFERPSFRAVDGDYCSDIIDKIKYTPAHYDQLARECINYYEERFDDTVTGGTMLDYFDGVELTDLTDHFPCIKNQIAKWYKKHPDGNMSSWDKCYIVYYSKALHHYSKHCGENNLAVICWPIPGYEHLQIVESHFVGFEFKSRPRAPRKTTIMRKSDIEKLSGEIDSNIQYRDKITDKIELYKKDRYFMEMLNNYNMLHDEKKRVNNRIAIDKRKLRREKQKIN